MPSFLARAGKPQPPGLDGESETKLHEVRPPGAPRSGVTLLDLVPGPVEQHQPVLVRQATEVRGEPDPALVRHRHDYKELAVVLQQSIVGPELIHRYQTVLERVARRDEVERLLREV